MSLAEQINKDITTAMKEQEKFKLSVLRMLKSAIMVEKTKHDKDYELSDTETISIVKKQVKMRKDSITEFTKYGKTDQVADLEHEIEILSTYLPEELSDEAIDKILDEIWTELKPESMKDMGRVMKEATARTAGRADGSVVSAKVKARLS